MLIATMSNTFQRVTDNVDIEWTFGRMEVYIKYMLETTLPPPLNLIPTTQTLSSIKEWIDIYFKPINEEKAYLSLNKYCQIVIKLIPSFIYITKIFLFIREKKIIKKY